jgi:hypothetical protein
MTQHTHPRDVEGADLFGGANPVTRDYCFNPEIDALARNVGGWPEGATVFAMEVIGSGEDPQVMLTGGKPTGHSKQGIPSFKGSKDRLQAVVRVSEYRECLAGSKAEGRS